MSKIVIRFAGSGAFRFEAKFGELIERMLNRRRGGRHLFLLSRRDDFRYFGYLDDRFVEIAPLFLSVPQCVEGTHRLMRSTKSAMKAGVSVLSPGNCVISLDSTSASLLKWEGCSGPPEVDHFCSNRHQITD